MPRFTVLLAVIAMLWALVADAHQLAYVWIQGRELPIAIKHGDTAKDTVRNWASTRTYKEALEERVHMNTLRFFDGVSHHEPHQGIVPWVGTNGWIEKLYLEDALEVEIRASTSDPLSNTVWFPEPILIPVQQSEGKEGVSGRVLLGSVGLLLASMLIVSPWLRKLIPREGK